MIKTFPVVCASVASNPSALGVKLHNAGYVANNLDYTYIATGSTDIKKTIQFMREFPFRGLGVSMPFKQMVIEEIDEVDFSVKKIGACNTIVNDDGKLTGYNTDWVGAIDAIKEVVNIDSIKSAVIIGAGGVARAIAFGLRQNNINIFICARNKEQRENLVRDLSLQGSGSLEEQGQFKGDLIVNATPVSTVNSPLKLYMHKEAKVLFDVAFQKRTTELMKNAENRGLLVVHGWRMLLYQGMKQFELYTKQKAPLEAMSKVLEEALPD